MEKLDKNYIIGFILLFVMYGTYMYFMPQPLPETPQEVTQEAATTSKEAVAAAPVEKDSASVAKEFGDLAFAAKGEAKEVVLESDQLLVKLNTLGGGLESVTLKDYKTYDTFLNNGDAPMELIDKANSTQSILLNMPSGQVDLRKLHFEVEKVSKTAVTFVLNTGSGKIRQEYSLLSDGFIMDYKVSGENIPGFNAGQNVLFSWDNKLKKLEKDIDENRKAAQINYYDSEDDFTDIGLNSTSNEEESVEEPVKWFSFKQKYFTSGLLANTGTFSKMAASLKVDEQDSVVVKDAFVSAQFPADKLKDGFKYYFGPNDLTELNKMGDGFNKNLYLGYDLVKPINKFIFVPLFDWVESFISNYGLLIIIVVLMIKITLTPLIYKSYTSSAKMRLLAPEIAEIKERVGDDSVKVQQETMKLYQQVGVSPLSGCIPMLLQMPILMSVFFLFPNMEMFRQKSFLWANDLSTYDAPISWATSLPIIGNHLSLFVVLMTISSLAFTYYNNQVTPDQPGPIDMKKISYVFPLVFFFVLNSFPAALSFYYLVSNLVTIAQQLIVKRFIDEDKIRGILEENKKNYSSKPKKRNKFSDYLQKQLEAQEASNQQKASDLKKRKKK